MRYGEGSAADPWRVAQARHRNRADECGQVYGQEARTTIARLEDFPSPSCGWDRCDRPERQSLRPGRNGVHEIKHDGFRLIAGKRDGRVRLFTRRGSDWTDRYPRIVEAVTAIRASSITIDGEAVVCDAN